MRLYTRIESLRLYSRFVLANLATIALVLESFMEQINESQLVAFKWGVYVWALLSVISVLVWIGALVNHAWSFFNASWSRAAAALCILLGSPAWGLGPIAYYLLVVEFLTRRPSPQSKRTTDNAKDKILRQKGTPNQAL